MPASRTPEGMPSRCFVCGAEVNLEYSATGFDDSNDAPCPNCGCLLIRSAATAERLYTEIAALLGIDREDLQNGRKLGKLALDSLETVELVMSLEESFDADLPPEELKQIESVEDLVRLAIRYAAEPNE
ncbi:MAG: phosphopantetheine-binding protein [Planctomycetota bacterium]